MANVKRTAPTIDELQTFLDVTELGTRQAAANKTGSTRFRVTDQVNHVSRYFLGGDATLFLDGRSQLNEAGRLVREHVVQALDLLKTARDAVRSEGAIRIGFSPAAQPLIAATLRELRGVEIRVHEATAMVYREQLQHHEIDVAIGYNLGTKPSDQFEHDTILEQPLQLVLPREVAKREGTYQERLGKLRRCYISERLQRESFDKGWNWLESQGINRKDDRSGSGRCKTAGEMFTLISTGNFFGLLPALCKVTADRKTIVFEPLRGPEIDYRSELHAYYWKVSEPRLQAFFAAVKIASAQLNRRPRGKRANRTATR